jgi:hypothetical protein
MTQVGGSPLAEALADFAAAARDVIGRGGASAGQEAFAAQMREAAELLAHSPTTDEPALAARVGVVAANLVEMSAARTTTALSVSRAAEGPRATPEPIAPPVATEPARMPEVIAEPVVAPVTEPEPVAAPAAEPVPMAPVLEAAPRAAPLLGEADLATSYLTFEQLIAERGMPMGALDELIAGGATVPAAAAASAVPAGLPVVPVESLAPDADVVDVGTLLYRGDAALRRAVQLKTDLIAAAKRGDPQLHDLLLEVIDLVELGLGAGR